MYFGWFDYVYTERSRSAHHKFAQYKQRGHAYRQAGFAPILLILLVIILAGVAGGAYFFSRSSTKLEEIQPVYQAVQTPKPTTTDKLYAIFEPAKNGFKKYINPVYKYSINIPESWVTWPNAIPDSSEQIRFFANKEPSKGMGGYDEDIISLRITVYDNNQNSELLKRRFNAKIGEVIDGQKSTEVKDADMIINGLIAVKESVNTLNKPVDSYYAVVFTLKDKNNQYYDLEFLSPVKNQLNNYKNVGLLDQIANSFIKF